MISEQQLTPEQKIAYIELKNESTIHNTLGIRTVSYDPKRVVVEIDVDQRLHQPTGVVHGGLYVLLAESAASVAGTMNVDVPREFPLGMEINANHIRSVSSGTVQAIATPVHQGRTTHVYSIEVKDQEGRLLCISRCTLAIRKLSEEALQKLK